MTKKKINIKFKKILNDLKRRPEDAASDLGLSKKDINNSNLFNHKSISRNQSDLLKNLKKIKKSSIIKTNRQIFKGQKIKSTFFND